MPKKVTDIKVLIENIIFGANCVISIIVTEEKSIRGQYRKENLRKRYQLFTKIRRYKENFKK